ncbi:MAG: hypothetical protein ACPGYP_08790, partial [Solirubrobacterales bacterium]
MNLNRSTNSSVLDNGSVLIGTPRRTAIRIAILSTLAVLTMAFAPQLANAASFVVGTASNDDSLRTCSAVASASCSLPGAILEANDALGEDDITFATDYSIAIDTALPDVTDPLTINAEGQAIVVSGSGAYLCDTGEFALDITDIDAVPTYVRGISFNAVCGLAIRSNVPPPSIRVGPRRSNNTVGISGASGTASEVDVFRVGGGAVSGEATEFFQLTGTAGGNYFFLPSPTPSGGERFAAIASGPQGSSNYSAATTTPFDLASPGMFFAVGGSNSSVRVDFNESIWPTSANPAAFALTVGGIGRPVVGTLVSANSVFLFTNVPWATGEAGTVALTGAGRLTDYTGNEVLGQPIAPVFAGPGELTPPTISNFRFSPQKMCARKRRTCRRNYTYAYISLNKDARVVFKVYRGKKSRRRELVTFIRRLKAGRNKLRIRSSINGRRLPASTLTLRAVAQDVARTESEPADALFRLV